MEIIDSIRRFNNDLSFILDENEARKLLYHAVECVPQCLDMWI